MFTGPLPAVSNRETFTFLVDSTNPADDTAVDLTGAAIDIAIRAQGSATPNLSGSLSDKIEISGDAADGQFRVTFTCDDMASLVAGDYDMGIRVKLSNGNTVQLIVATLPVVDGIVDA